MRVVAGLLAEEVADNEKLAFRHGVRVHELLDPSVVPGAVGDDVLRGRDRSRVAGRGLVVVWVGIRVRDDAAHARVLAPDLRREAAPEVLGGDDADLARL